MVFLSVELGQGRVEVRAHLRHDWLTPVGHLCVEHAMPISGDEHQVDVEVVDDAATAPNIGVWVLGWVSEVVARFAV
jgi:hypothetical protein